MQDKVFIKNEKEDFWDSHPHWMLGIVVSIYVVFLFGLFHLMELNISSNLLLVILSITYLLLSNLIMIYYIVKKLSCNKAAGLIGFVKRDNVLYAIRLYGNYSKAGTYISIPPSMTEFVIASMPNNIDYAIKSLAIEKNIEKIRKDKNTYIVILENLLHYIKNNRYYFNEDTINYKLDMIINKYGFKRYTPNPKNDFYCGYIIMNNPKIVKSNNKWFELSFTDEENNSKIMRFKNVYTGLLDELKNI